MRILDVKFETCSTCGHKTRIDDKIIVECDYCHIKYNFNNDEEDMLRVVVFFKEDQSVDYDLCSWKCVFNLLKSIKCDYFVSLPEIMFDTNKKERSYMEFLEEITF